MSTPSSNQYFEAFHSSGTPPSDPNLFTAAEIVAGSFDSAAVSTATSKAVSTITAAAPDSTSISQARSQAVSAASIGSIADSKAVSDSVVISVVDSKTGSVSANTSIADSKAVSIAIATPTITAVVYSGAISVADSKAVSDSVTTSTADSKAVSVSVCQPAVGRTVTTVPTYLLNNAVFNIKDWGAIGDGNSHPLSGFFATLTLARVVYPHATALTNEIDWAATQGALNACNTAGGGTVHCPAGTYLVTDLTVPRDNIKIVGVGSGLSYGSTSSVSTIFKAISGTTTVFNLVITGTLIDRTGCLLQDLVVNGNLQASYGARCSNNNLFIRFRAEQCLTAGVNFANFTNGSRLYDCSLSNNFGSGFKAEGASTTIYTVDKCQMSSNQVFGMDIQAGVLARFTNTIIESNQGPAINIYRPDTHNGAFSGLVFDTLWFEANGVNAAISYNNGTGAPLYSLSIDAQTRSQANAPTRIKFFNCRFQVGIATRKYLYIPCSRWVTFEDCEFATSTASDALNGAATTYFAAFLECSSSSISVDGLTVAQLDNLQAAGAIRSYWSDRDTKRAVLGGVGFQNAWVNFGAPYGAASYWFDREGNVCLSGAIKTGTIGQIAFTLPVGYRPSVTTDFAVESNAAHGIARADVNGNIYAYFGNNGIFNLNNVKFSTL